MKKYEKELNEAINLYNDNLNIQVEFKRGNFMHLVGFDYNLRYKRSIHFYNGLLNNNIDWKKVNFSSSKHYTEMKLKSFKSFFDSQKFNIIVNNAIIEISYSLTNKKNALLILERSKTSDIYYPKSFKSVNVSMIKNGENIEIIEL